MGHDNKVWWSSPALILAIISYTSIIVVWSVRQEGKIVQLQSEVSTLNQRMNELDFRGSRQIPALEAKIDELNRLINRHLGQPPKDKP